MQYRINYSKVVSQANAIKADGDDLARQIKMLEQMEQECRSAWKGPAADVFIAKLSSLRGEMNQTKNQITNLATTIKRCADKIQNEDRLAAERAAALKS